MLEWLAEPALIQRWQVLFLIVGYLGLKSMKRIDVRADHRRSLTLRTRALLVSDPSLWWTPADVTSALAALPDVTNIDHFRDTLPILRALLEEGAGERKWVPGGPERGHYDQSMYRWKGEP